MNRGQIRDRLTFVLNANDGQTDAAFSNARLNQAIDFAYMNEVTDAQQEGSESWFKRVTQVTWPASQRDLEIPSALRAKRIIDIYDVTNNDTGYRFTIKNDPTLVWSGALFYVQDAQQAYWEDYKTLRYANEDGPSSALTLKFYHIALPADIEADEDIPDLIPEEFHELLVWSAAILLRQIADEAAPPAWISRWKDRQAAYHKHISTGRPDGNNEWFIGNTSPTTYYSA